jgi:hypothetical protein
MDSPHAIAMTIPAPDSRMPPGAPASLALLRTNLLPLTGAGAGQSR